MPLQQPLIFVVDDNILDICLMKDAINILSLDNQFTYISDSNIASDILKAGLTQKHMQHLKLIILDLNMPGKSGYDLLKEIKSDKRYSSVKVAIFSATEREDFVGAFKGDFAPDYFLTKPEGIWAYSTILYDLCQEAIV